MKSSSSFVTVLAWTSLLLSGFCAVMLLLQGVLVYAFFEATELGQEILRDPEFGKFLDTMPLGLGFLGLFLIFLVASVVTFIVSLGLLKRREWARKGFIVLMALGIVWSVLSIFTMPSYGPESLPTGDPVAEAFDATFQMLTVVTILLTIAIVVLHGWIIRKLMAPSVKEEFSRA